MTVLLLNIVFSLALSRAFSIPLSEFLGLPATFLPQSLVPNFSSNGTGDSQTGVGKGSNDDNNKAEWTHYALDEGEREVAAMVDAFGMTYSSAYRSVYDAIVIVGHPNFIMQ